MILFQDNLYVNSMIYIDNRHVLDVIWCLHCQRDMAAQFCYVSLQCNVTLLPKKMEKKKEKIEKKRKKIVMKNVEVN